MDKYEHSTRQYKTTDTIPKLHKARCDIARALDLLKNKHKLNKHKHKEANMELIKYCYFFVLPVSVP